MCKINGRGAIVRVLKLQNCQESEIMDGSCLNRIKPMTEEQREMSERCVRRLGYQGNDILCSNCYGVSSSNGRTNTGICSV